MRKFNNFMNGMANKLYAIGRSKRYVISLVFISIFTLPTCTLNDIPLVLSINVLVALFVRRILETWMNMHLLMEKIILITRMVVTADTMEQLNECRTMLGKLKDAALQEQSAVVMGMCMPMFLDTEDFINKVERIL